MAEGAVDELERVERRARIRASYAGMFVPVVIAAATIGIGWLQNDLAARQRAADSLAAAEPQCFDQLVAVVDAKGAIEKAGSDPGALNLLRERYILIANKAEATCRRANFPLPASFETSLRAAGIAVQQPELRRLAGETATSLEAPPPAAPMDEDPLAIDTTRANASVRPAVPITLFVQIANESQRDRARELALALEGQTVEGRPITVPGIELVSRPPPVNDLRCLKAEDCAINAAFAALLSEAIGAPVKPVSLADRFGTSASVRPGTFELWLAAS
jgi:hypothetical protein